jgi:hypothetical protein
MGSDLYSLYTPVQNVWQATGQNMDNGLLVQTHITTPQATAQNQQSDLLTVIKDWGGYSSNALSDSQMLGKIGLTGNYIPSWVKKTTEFVVNGEISPQDFTNSINYLSQKGLIK